MYYSEGEELFKCVLRNSLLRCQTPPQLVAAAGDRADRREKLKMPSVAAKADELTVRSKGGNLRSTLKGWKALHEQLTLLKCLGEQAARTGFDATRGPIRVLAERLAAAEVQPDRVEAVEASRLKTCVMPCDTSRGPM
jgi:hypothetical protein